ncbi:MAG: thioredoxin [Candidatus Dojkabacteria bacterium]|nr:thioredoxin [Candidatus Dojkabacteria bacterium]
MEKVLTDSNFKDEIASGLVLVDFWAPWCAPCRMLGPIIEEVAGEVDGVTVGKLNVDENPMVASQFQIMSIPTVMLFKDGEPVETMIGLRPKDAYLQAIEAHK